MLIGQKWAKIVFNSLKEFFFQRIKQPNHEAIKEAKVLTINISIINPQNLHIACSDQQILDGLSD